MLERLGRGREMKIKKTKVLGFRTWLECRNASCDLLERGGKRRGFNRGFVAALGDTFYILFVLPGA